MLRDFGKPVWRVSWSVTGNVLAVSTGDSVVTLWKESLDGNWVELSTLDNSSSGGAGGGSGGSGGAAAGSAVAAQGSAAPQPGAEM